MPIVSPPLTAHFAPLATGYDVVLSDVWGVVHNGAVAFAEACDALARFREGGGTVVLITNAPRPGDTVARLTLDPFGVSRDTYDGIVSSGDVTHALIAAREGQRVFHIGPERDLPIYRRARCAHRGFGARRLCGLLGAHRRHGGDAARLPRPHRADARTRPSDDLRQSRRGGGARRQAGLLRGRDRRSLCRRRRRRDLCGQAVSADL